MRTTKKEFKLQVQKHIIDRLSDDEFSTVEEQLQDVVRQFENYSCAYEQRRNPNKYSRFIDWLKGLPSCIHNEYSHYNIYMSLKEWFEACGETYVERDSDKEAELYYHLFVREFETLCKKYDVKF
ncbi:hypothetical protein PQE66_gp016 [Bacillus phage PBC2]|uniref:Uncharacterized protein n=1 Tax=Bacillus phage PBC2 TaxID=1675029 RepID=A0A218KBR3_9CAUD|nr:hypothetical protein PQE66_gp016 [Bacillus phage PBC2]AKQ08331.1 hypothetical protein PBC2_016 [Bacillus phage PBC2]